MKDEALQTLCVSDLPGLEFEAGAAGKTNGNPVLLDIFRDIFIGLRDLLPY